MTASADHDAIVWDARTGEDLELLRGHGAIVSDAAFSSDGRWIVTAGPGRAGLWEVGTAKLLTLLDGHLKLITSAEFGEEGYDVFTAGHDGTVRTYECEVCAPLSELLALADRRLAGLGLASLACPRGDCLQDIRRVPAGRRPAAGDRGALREPAAGRPLPDAARRHRHRQDGHDGLDHRADPAPRARDRAQQDARRAALQRVPRVLPARTRSSTSSPTTTTTSPRRTSRRPTSTSRRTRPRTTTSRGSGCKRPPRSSRAATPSSSPPSPASTASARPRSGASAC